MAASLLLAVPPLLQISQDLATLQSDCHPLSPTSPWTTQKGTGRLLSYVFPTSSLSAYSIPDSTRSSTHNFPASKLASVEADPQQTRPVTLLTQNIEDAFDAGEKAGVVLLDLSAAYDTVWLRGLHLKLLQMIPDRHMVKFINGDAV